MFPYAHAKSVSDVTIQFSTKCFHTSNLKVVYPPSDQLIKFLNLVAVADAPSTTSEFFHPLLELCY